MKKFFKERGKKLLGDVLPVIGLIFFYGLENVF